MTPRKVDACGDLVHDLQAGAPVILGYRNLGTNSGHAVVATGLELRRTADGRPDLDHSASIYRDPWPGIDGPQRKTFADHAATFMYGVRLRVTFW